MSNKKIIISSLSMDLKRVALGLYRGSRSTADRFIIESFKRMVELDSEEIDGEIKTLISKTRNSLQNISERTADDALMYSTLFQNQATRMI